MDIDLERFFDTVDHTKQIEILQRTIKDNGVISLIHSYLNTVVMEDGAMGRTDEGTPQGGPLCPLLANVSKVKFLGYGFRIYKGKCRLRLHQKSEAQLRRLLKESVPEF